MAPEAAERIAIESDADVVTARQRARALAVGLEMPSTDQTLLATAISEERPVMITDAPMSRDASTVWTRWLATVESIAGTPVMSITTTRARFVRIPRSSCSVSWRARWPSSTPMIGRISSRSRTWRTGVESSRIASCWFRIVRSRA